MRQRIKIQRLLSIKKQKIHQQEIVRLEQEKEIKRVNGVLEGQNQERNRLAKEIHDGIGGSLAGIKLQLSQENTSLKNENIEVVINQIGSAFNELRAISHNLSFNFLKDKNLENLVNQLKIDHESRDEFELDVVVFPENSLSNLSEFIKHNLYRIIQELITNVSKHASANKVLLSFTRHEKVLNIILEDNGVGFVNKKSGGIGFKNIQERIISLNATIVFDSLLHQGTTIIIDIPTYE